MLRRRAQLIYLYKPTPVTIIGLLPKLLFRTPVVVDIDDLGSQVMRLEGQSRLQAWLVSTCERLAIRYASAVVVTSTYLEALVRRQYPDKPVLLLSNGVDPTIFAQVKKSPPRPAIYYFGALNRLSLIETFLRALPATLKAVPTTTVTILGGGSALAAIKHLSQELGLSDHIAFTGWIGPEQVKNYIQYADIAICTQPDIPTVRAASNLKVFQYMALGTVPVVSDVGDLKRYVSGNEAVGIAVEADDSERLAKALITLLNDPQGRAKMAGLARQQAETVYSWSFIASQLNDFLRLQAQPQPMELSEVHRNV